MTRPGGRGTVERVGITQRRLSRRLLLTDFGKFGLGIAVLGACSGGSPSVTPARPIESDPDEPEPTSREPDGTEPAGSEPESTEPADTQPDSSQTDDPVGSELQWSRVSLGFVSAYVMVRGRRAAVVDTGSPGSAPAILDALGALDVGWSDVDHVVLTHHHGDHVGSIDDVLAGATAATAYAGTADIESISSARPLQAVDDGDEIFGMQVIHTPGHTPGSISLLDGDTGLLVAGDALVSDGGRVGGSIPRFTADEAAANASIVKLASLDFDTAVFGHGDPIEGGAAEQVQMLAAELG